MTFKTRVALSFGLFVLLVAGLGAGLMVNAFREERAFSLGRNALRSQFMAQEMDYFVNRKIKALEAYVMLQEDLEKIVIDESNAVLEKKFDVWGQWVKSGDASGAELAQVREVYGAVQAKEAEILSLMDRGSRDVAMRAVGGDFQVLAKKARDALKELTAKKAQDAVEAERAMQRVVRQSHLTSVAGAVLAMILGVVLAMSLYNSVMLPMKVLSMWSDQIAKGHLHVSLNIPGNSEVGRLAQNFNDMVHNLSRQHQDQVDQERTRAEEREKERMLEQAREKSLAERRRQAQEKEQEEVSTLEDAVEGFREILDIMGAPPAGARQKKKNV